MPPKCDSSQGQTQSFGISNFLLRKNLPSRIEGKVNTRPHLSARTGRITGRDKADESLEGMGRKRSVCTAPPGQQCHEHDAFRNSMMTSHYWHLHHPSMTSCDLTAESLEAARRDWLCTDCQTAIAGVGPFDVCIVNRTIPARSLSWIVPGGICVVHLDLLDKLSQWLTKKTMSTGHISDANGREFHSWRTVWFHHRVIIRGTTEVSCRVCDQCGRNAYFALGEEYLSPEPAPEVEAFGSCLSGIVIRSSPDRMRSLKSHPGLRIDELPILDPAPDGLGKLIP